MNVRHSFFCPQCGLGAGVDEDGCCTGCGCDTCTFDELKRLLRAKGFFVVGIYVEGGTGLVKVEPA